MLELYNNKLIFVSILKIGNEKEAEVLIDLDKLIEKMGLYDIWTILFPGAVFLVAIKTIYNFMLLLPEQILKTTRVIEKIFIFCEANIYAPGTVYELMIFLLYSYFVGLMLHEISSLFKNRVMYKQGKPIDFLLDSKGGVFEDEEIQILMPMYIQLNGGAFTLNDNEKQKKESRSLFHKINADLQRKKVASQYVKLNVIYNTCATLGITLIFILGLVLAFEIEFIILKKFDLILSIISLDVILIVGIYILLSRSKRYYKYWTKNIVLAYQNLYLYDTCESEEQN